MIVKGERHRIRTAVWKEVGIQLQDRIDIFVKDKFRLQVRSQTNDEVRGKSWDGTFDRIWLVFMPVKDLIVDACRGEQ